MNLTMKTCLANMILIGMGSIFLSGCAISSAKKDPEPVTKVETKVIKVPEVWLVDCEISSPPDQTQYVSGNPQDREELLTNYNIALLKEIENCNKRFKAIGIYQNNSVKILQETKQ